MPPCALCYDHTACVTMRHNLLLGAQRCIAHCAGVAKAVDLAMERLWAGTGTAPEAWRHGGSTAWLSGRRSGPSSGKQPHPAHSPEAAESDWMQAKTASTPQLGMWPAALHLTVQGDLWPPWQNGHAVSRHPGRQRRLLCVGRLRCHSLVFKGPSKSLVWLWSEIVYREARHVCATAGSTAVPAGAPVLIVDPA
jgi:hypothetical protein